uniref:HA domain-containing protein n=1 Tax=Heligmosomoides polygyrus TaxID=6339 RepID=A0A183FY95_HELPZ
LLSPSLFSLHEEGNEVEKAFSLPRMLKELPNKDQEAWLNFIMEASGVTDAVDKAEKTQRDMREKEMRLPDGTPMYFTKENATKYGGEVEKRKIETFERLDRTYTKDQKIDGPLIAFSCYRNESFQKEELEQRGYAFMDSKQLSIVYGPNSPFNKSDSLQLFKSLRRMHDDPHHMIESE